MFCLNGTGPTLSCEIFPPFDTSVGEWEAGLIDLSTFYSIPNIETGANKFYYGENRVITFEEGSYEIEDIEKYLVKHLADGVHLRLKANNSTLKTELYCSEKVDFTPQDSLNTLLGFDARVLEARKEHVSDDTVNILKVNVIRVECNIVRGSYDNGSEGHTLHEFFPNVSPGYKIVEIPATIVYLPVNVRTVTNVTVTLRDQDGSLINFRGEAVSLRIHIRRKDGSHI